MTVEYRQNEGKELSVWMFTV